MLLKSKRKQMNLEEELKRISEIAPCNFSRFLDYKTPTINHVKGMESTFKGLEMNLHWNGFNLKNIIKAGDEGDDGGFFISLSERNDKLFLHIFYVSAYSDLSCVVVSEEQFNGSGFPDFVCFDTIEEVDEYLAKFIKNLDELVKEYVRQDIDWSNGEDNAEDQWFYGHDEEEFDIYNERFNKNWSKQYIGFLQTCFQPYESESTPYSFDISKEEVYTDIENIMAKSKIRNKILNLTKTDNSDFYQLQSQIDNAKLKQFTAEMQSLRYKIENPKMFKFDWCDVEKIKRKIGEDYHFDTHHYYNAISEYDIDALLHGRTAMLEIKSVFESEYMTHEIIAKKYDTDFDLPDRGSRTLKINCIETGFQKEKKCFFHVKKITIETAIRYLYDAIEDIILHK